MFIDDKYYNDFQLTANFNLREFMMKGSKQVIVYMPLVWALQDIRNMIGCPLMITSGYREASYNATIPGAHKNSEHIYGLAVDVYPADGDLLKVVRAAEAHGVPNIIYYEPGKLSKSGHVHLGMVKPAEKKTEVIETTPEEINNEEQETEHKETH